MALVPVRVGQIWGDAKTLRELTVKRVDQRHAYFIDDSGRRTRIQLRRLVPANGYYLKVEATARYVEVPSEEGTCVCGHVVDQHEAEGCRVWPSGHCPVFQSKTTYKVWTGDLLSPPHCPCENFRWAERKAGEVYKCKHIKRALGEGME